MRCCYIVTAAQAIIYELQAKLPASVQGSSVLPVTEKDEVGIHMEKEACLALMAPPFLVLLEVLSQWNLMGSHSLFPAWFESTTGSPESLSTCQAQC